MQHRKHIKDPPESADTAPPNTPPVSTPFRKRKFFFFLSTMSAFLSTLLLFFFIAACVSGKHKAAVNTNPVSGYPIIREVCRASRDPSTCETSFSSRPPENASVIGAIDSALRLSSQNRDVGREMVQNILDSSAAKFNLSNAAKTCLELLGYSKYRTDMAGGALSRGAIKDARAWMSASLVYHYDCWSGLRYVNDTSDIVLKTMYFFNTSLIVSSANALAMIANYDVSGEKTDLWTPPKTERDGFWEPAQESTGFVFSGGFPVDLKPDVTVCKTGCNYATVQEAVNAAPENPTARNRFVIWIKTGVYEEMVRVPFEKKNVVFLGDGMGKTLITGSANVAYQGVTTYNTATVGVMGDGFMASGITFQNKAGPEAHQAVAFRSDSDLSVIDNCEFLGNQDTLYAHSLRQYYKSCRIQGNVDFIFGNSAVFFQDCLILIATRQVYPEKGEKNAVTAHGRIDPAQSTGFVFHNCVINGTDEYMSLYRSKPSVHKTFLGRPWKEYSRTVFIRCTLEELIMPDGWLPWNGDFALRTLYYGEFENMGPGSDTSQRVKWSSSIPAEHVHYYSVQNFIQGDQWIPTSS